MNLMDVKFTRDPLGLITKIKWFSAEGEDGKHEVNFSYDYLNMRVFGRWLNEVVRMADLALAMNANRDDIAPTVRSSGDTSTLPNPLDIWPNYQRPQEEPKPRYQSPFTPTEQRNPMVGR